MDDMTDEAPIAFDLSRLETLARERWEDNWNFRSYLLKNVPARDVDAAVNRINDAVSKRIDCTACGNCCREIFPYLSGKDVLRLADGMGLSPPAFREKYVKRTPDGDQVFCTVPCPLLRETRCTVYETRPDDCRGYPHLHKPDFLERSIGVIENYRVCPIVHNVYERLKSAFTYDPAVDYVGDDVLE